MVEVAAIDAETLRHGVYATLAYFFVYLCMLLNQSMTSQVLARKAKHKNKPFVKYYNASDERLLRADRIVGNTLEQMGPFLALYWLAIYVCSVKGQEATAHTAALSGYIYVLGRVLYGPIWSISGSSARGIRPLILAATVPCYLVQAYCAWSLATAV